MTFSKRTVPVAVKVNGGKPEFADFETQFEFAYRLMLSELMPSFLHELNNPLTALNGLQALARNSNMLDDDTLSDLFATLGKANQSLLSLSESGLQISRADNNTPIALIHPILHSLLILLAPRFRRESLEPQLYLDEKNQSIQMPPRKLALLLYASLESCLQITHQADLNLLLPLPLPISTHLREQSNTVDVDVPRQIVENLKMDWDDSEEMTFARSIQVHFAATISPVFDFIYRTVDRLIQESGIRAGFEQHEQGLRLRIRF